MRREALHRTRPRCRAFLPMKSRSDRADRESPETVIDKMTMATVRVVLAMTSGVTFGST